MVFSSVQQLSAFGATVRPQSGQPLDLGPSGDHHPAAGRGGQHRRRLALPRPPAQPAPTNDHEML